MSLYIKVKKTDGSTLIAQSTTIAPTSWSYDSDLPCDGSDNANSVYKPLKGFQFTNNCWRNFAN